MLAARKGLTDFGVELHERVRVDLSADSNFDGVVQTSNTAYRKAMDLSVIIPTLNEETCLPATIATVADAAPGCEIIIADGGSTDCTYEVVSAFTIAPVRWIDSPRGRGAQMNAGAAIATGDVLLFLHADTLLPARSAEMIRHALDDSRIVGGNFCVRFAPRGVVADFYTWCYNMRSRARVFYGDSAIFVRRDVFQRIGGYRYARIMEDLELVRRLRRAGRVHTIRDAEVTSSARRFLGARSGIRALTIWTWLHILFYCGASQEALERRYPPVR